MGVVTCMGNHSVGCDHVYGGITEWVWSHVWGSVRVPVVTFMGVVTSVGNYSLGCGHI